jgi:hypothetical protein
VTFVTGRFLYVVFSSELFFCFGVLLFVSCGSEVKIVCFLGFDCLFHAVRRSILFKGELCVVCFCVSFQGELCDVVCRCVFNF